jgi:hypothetical protein
MKISYPRLLELAAGVTLAGSIVFVFDNVLYPLAVWKYGLVRGGMLMATFSAVFCFGAILAYDRTRRDLVGLEALKELKAYEGSHCLGRVFAWILRRGDLAAFLFLSFFSNPFMATVYLRRESHVFNGLGGREWAIFTASFVLSNASWASVCFTGVSFLEWLYREVVPILGTLQGFATGT